MYPTRRSFNFLINNIHLDLKTDSWPNRQSSQISQQAVKMRRAAFEDYLYQPKFCWKFPTYWKELWNSFEE